MSLRRTRSQTKAANASKGVEVTASRRQKRRVDQLSSQDAERAPKRAQQSVSLDDVQFLEKAKKQMSTLDLPANSIRTKTLHVLNQYLERLQPIEQKGVKALCPAAHFLTTEEARHLLGSDAHLGVPVFVSGCRLPSTLEEGSPKRPIEQLFEWLDDEVDRHETPNVETTEEEMSSYNVREIKKAFRRHNGYTKYPTNFADIPSNLPGSQIPPWIATPNCSFLNNLMGTVMDNSVEDVLNAHMVNESEEPLQINNEDGKPVPNFAELVELSMAWRHWQTTIMLAEAGAVTLPHWDRYGLATWIHCIEGEIGFAWLDRPTKKEHIAWMRQDIQGRWLFKVIRPGDTLYMPGGTVHLVFRLPHGKQTAGFAGNLIRRCDVNGWLRILAKELEFEIDEPSDVPYLRLLPQIMLTVIYLLKNQRSQDDTDKHGGRGDANDLVFRNRLETVRRLLMELNEQA
ncbi:hypothetical protein K431DRAFT_315696 [Polychaeton citri CBS 116435]|uniref:JmjC domain-containing protein n=1 Tax=Polychaeton citri CBS 116435 TaxID=1314669 RepID=A0A9P4UM12_9PEZI|nr:hypothetical protein K431DRAFT_315696 [Polychaeton citri CBS 116435]